MRKLLFVLGTRPEAIKLCPLILEAKSRPSEFDVVVVNTGQHQELIDSVMDVFQVQEDYNLVSMVKNQSLAYSISDILPELDSLIKQDPVDFIIVQGDTTSTYTGALAGYLNKIPVVHVEAGMRSGDIYSPFPEEGYRKMISQIASFHFCATDLNAENLNNEGITQNIWTVGNTGLDAIQNTLKNIQSDFEFNKNRVLLTLHRREGFEFMGPVMEAINYLTEHAGVQVVFPMHPNPNLRKVIKEHLHTNSNLRCIEPLNYPSFIEEMYKANVILTDSGGVQEEAPFIGKSVVVIREKTERTETLGKSSHLVGFNKSKIIAKTLQLLEESAAMKPDYSYGDGCSSKRICDILSTK